MARREVDAYIADSIPPLEGGFKQRLNLVCETMNCVNKFVGVHRN